MSPRSAARLAWSLWAVGVALAVAALVFLVISWEAPTPEGQFGFRGFAVVFAFTFGTVGALVASRHPGNPLGWIFLGLGVASGFQELANQYAIHAILGDGGDLPLAEAAAWVPAWIWVPATSGAMFILLLFPDGRPPSPRWRWVLAVGVLGTAVASVGFALEPGPLENFAVIDNPFGLGPEGTMSAVGEVGLAFYGVAIVLSALSLVARFRRSRGEQRQQLKWLAASGLLLSLALASSFVGQFARGTDTNEIDLRVAVLVIAGFASLPVATGIAILRHRLFDIDIVISKTLVYAALAVFITVVYVGVVVGVGTLVGARGDPFLSAVAAALVALAFQPVRRSAQRFANRLVYGERATPYEVLSELSGRFAGTYSLDDVLPRMARTVAEATGAAEADVFLAFGDELRPAASWPADAPPAPALPLREDAELPGADLTVPVRHAGRVLGALAVTKGSGGSLTPTEERLVHDLAGQAGLVLRNVALLEELRASRRRIVQAQDDRARALERNIHDGAQQQLVALSVKLRLAQQLAQRDPPKAAAALEELQGELQSALEDLRDLARGIYPPLLADKGLAEALQAQARKVPIPVEVVADGVGRYQPEIESTVYFCVLEALQNVSKYAQATRSAVRLGVADGDLRFAVEDDGVGFDPGATPRGTGLQNLEDRLAAVGGELEIVSAPGAGTTVRGSISIGGTAT